MKNPNELIALLPYDKPFLFVDQLTEISEAGAAGSYTFRADEYFYAGHFRNEPLTPGVILIETMAQIGLVSLGIFIVQQGGATAVPKFAFVSSNVEFRKPVFPGETVFVMSEKLYFRLGKLKCKVTMTNEAGELVCSGELAGMILKQPIA